MNSILVLIDFTYTSEIAVDQAIALSRLSGANIVLSHIAKSDSQIASDEFQAQVKPYEDELRTNGVKYGTFIKAGNFKSMVTGYVNEHHPDLVVVGTHGKHGLRQNLFGSNIYDLTKRLKTSILVVNDHMPITFGGFLKVLLPVGAHPDYITEVKQICNVISEDGEVEIFNITKAGVTLEKDILDNIELAKEYFDSQNVKWKYTQEESQTFSVGYSKEILEYAANNESDLISIMVNHAHHTGSEAMDKENILLNTEGIPVICANG